VRERRRPPYLGGVARLSATAVMLRAWRGRPPGYSHPEWTSHGSGGGPWEQGWRVRAPVQLARAAPVIAAALQAVPALALALALSLALALALSLALALAAPVAVVARARVVAAVTPARRAWRQSAARVGGREGAALTADSSGPRPLATGCPKRTRVSPMHANL